MSHPDSNEEDKINRVIEFIQSLDKRIEEVRRLNQEDMERFGRDEYLKLIEDEDDN